MYEKKNIEGLIHDMLASLKQPLTEYEAKQVVHSALSLIHCLFLYHNEDQKIEVDSMLESLGFKIEKEPVNRVALGHLALMFPKLSEKNQALLVALSPTDI